VPGVFTPVLAKHSKSFNLIDTLAVGVDRIQRNFEPMQRQIELWRQTQITDAQAKLIFYSAFVDGKLDAPKGLLPEVYRHYFEPQYPELSPRTMDKPMKLVLFLLAGNYRIRPFGDLFFRLYVVQAVTLPYAVGWKPETRWTLSDQRNCKNESLRLCCTHLQGQYDFWMAKRAQMT
jgi:hypothetical protein